MNKNTNANENYKGKRVKIINTECFLKYDYKDLEKYIGENGTIKRDYEGHKSRFVIDFDSVELNIIDEENGRLCFSIDSVEFLDSVNDGNGNNEFKVGDIVEVSNKYNNEFDTAGGSYSDYPSFFIKNNLNELKDRYMWKGVKNGFYEIVAIGKHFQNLNTIVYVLESYDKEIYLMCNDYNEISKLTMMIMSNEVGNEINNTSTSQLHAKLGDTIILSNNLKIKVCKDYFSEFNSKQYYKTVDISCNTNITIGYTEENLKEFYLGNKMWGYGAEEFEIVDIVRKEVKEKKVKVEQCERKNKACQNPNPIKTVYQYKLLPYQVVWEVSKCHCR